MLIVINLFIISFVRWYSRFICWVSFKIARLDVLKCRWIFLLYLCFIINSANFINDMNHYSVIEWIKNKNNSITNKFPNYDTFVPVKQTTLY